MKKIAIIGSGVMGHGIGQLYAQHNSDVTMYDLNDQALDKAREMISDSLSAMKEKEIITDEDIRNTFSHLTFTTDLSEAVKGAEMVVEVVPEVLDLKHKVYRQIEEVVSDDTIIASNTSAIPLTELVEDASHPERFIITHYFAPAQIIPLVEIIQLEGKTKPELLEKVQKYLKSCGKSPIVLKKEVPGFIANRMQMALMREAFWLYENGIASAEDIDTVLKDSIGFRYVFLGPLEGQDIAGIGTTYNVSKKLFPVLDDRKEPHPFLQEMMDNNTVGIRSNKGFYEYTEESGKEKIRRRNDNFLEVFKLRQKQQGNK
ncbi:3-hydroxyacyl-CoA dehydrogenase family protein [Proteiniclasticum sp. C24MP]|uniref:3-hydroxyacyl-CoA dehydrogenase family protein n=1 Tax=Proteiniclasticum sp. C24MP TaxID=3374101 RepID=UPI003753EED6